MRLDHFPRFGHILRPVDVVKNEYCFRVRLLQTLLKVAERRLFAVVAIIKEPIQPLYRIKIAFQRYVKIALDKLDTTPLWRPSADNLQTL